MNERIYREGLQGIVAARTRLSHVDGIKGELLIAGYPVEELAFQASFEDVVYLLWHGHRADAKQHASFQQQLARHRQIPQATVELLRAACVKAVSPMDALRMGVGTLDLNEGSSRDEQAAIIVACLPTIAATYARLRGGHEPIAPDPTLGHAANYLYMLHGRRPTATQARALETYLITVVDHGLNASTFTARVIVSTGSDLISAVVGAIGALKGPLHGGAPGPALDTVLEIGQPEEAESILQAKLARGERLMGFGHRIYKVRDPRAEVLSKTAASLYESDEQIAGDRALYELARAVERKAVALLERVKPGRNLQTNVEYYTALLLHGLGLSNDLFTPTFAVGRAPGWIAHCLEQQENGRLIRPSSEYTGERREAWVSA